ncbi:MAG: hypothetical protein R3F62_01790 [Planctomycetota bacterium]
MEWVGWASSVLLLATLVYQIKRHHDAGTNGGVSRWLYVGQLCASSGFLVYSLGVGDPVFVATNALLILAALGGLGIHRAHARRASAAE